MERGSAIPLLIGVVMFSCLIALHLAGSGSSSNTPPLVGSFAGPMTSKPRPLEIDHSSQAGVPPLRQVACAGAVARGTRCYIAGR